MDDAPAWLGRFLKIDNLKGQSVMILITKNDIITMLIFVLTQLELDDIIMYIIKKEAWYYARCV